MDKAILIKSISIEELYAEIRKIVKEEVTELVNIEHEKLLSINDVCKLFVPKISRVTFHNWSNKGLIKQEKIGGRVYVKHSNVLAALKTIQRIKRTI